MNDNDISWSAINTDGKACVMLLQKHTQLRQKNILIIGAGGTASGIIEALSEYNLNVFIYNRTIDNATRLAKTFNCSTVTHLEKCDLQFDIIISTVPPEAYQQSTIIQHLNNNLRKSSILMDVNYHNDEPPLKQLAHLRHATFIHGKALFKQQAYLQQEYWQG